MKTEAIKENIKEAAIMLSLIHLYRKAYPQLEQQELLCVAVLAALEAENKWCSEKGASRSAYVYTAVNNALRRTSVRTVVFPMSGKRADLSDDLLLSDQVPHDIVEQGMMWRRLHRHILSQTAGEGARMVLLEGCTIAEACAATCTDPGTIRNSTRKARRCIRRDKVLQEYVRSLP